jgi:hypothetical protein
MNNTRPDLTDQLEVVVLWEDRTWSLEMTTLPFTVDPNSASDWDRCDQYVREHVINGPEFGNAVQIYAWDIPTPETRP